MLLTWKYARHLITLSGVWSFPLQDGGSNNLVLSQTLTAPGGSNNTDFGRKVRHPQPSFVRLLQPLRGVQSA